MSPQPTLKTMNQFEEINSYAVANMCGNLPDGEYRDELLTYGKKTDKSGNTSLTALIWSISSLELLIEVMVECWLFRQEVFLSGHSSTGDHSRSTSIASRWTHHFRLELARLPLAGYALEELQRMETQHKAPGGVGGVLRHTARAIDAAIDTYGSYHPTQTKLLQGLARLSLQKALLSL